MGISPTAVASHVIFHLFDGTPSRRVTSLAVVARSLERDFVHVRRVHFQPRVQLAQTLEASIACTIEACLTLPRTFATNERQREHVWEKTKFDSTSRCARATTELPRAGGDRRCNPELARTCFCSSNLKTKAKRVSKKRGRDDSEPRNKACARRTSDLPNRSTAPTSKTRSVKNMPKLEAKTCRMRKT